MPGKKDLNLFRIIYSSVVAGVLVLLFAGQALADAEFIIVVHRDNPVKSLTTSQVKSIFLGKERFWSDGSAITLIMNKNEDIHEAFTRLMLQKSPAQLSVYWKKILYSGASMLPLVVKDDEAVKSYMSLHANTISYVDVGSLDKQVRKVEVVP